MGVGDIGWWRDNAGSQTPGTAWGGVNFASQQRLDNSNYSKPNDSTIEIESSGNFLIIATIRYGGGTGRFTPQGRLSLTTGSGSLWTSYFSGFLRDASETDAWVKIIGVYHGGSANDQIQIQHRRDTDANTTGTVINTSDVQIVQIAYSNIGIYTDTTGGYVYSGTSPNTVNLDNNVVQTDSAAIERSGDTVTVKGNNKRYLILWCVAGSNGGSRTQRIGHLEYDGTDSLPTRAYCYQRNASNEYAGLGGMDIVETATVDIAIEMEVFQGPGVAADQGGCDVAGSWSSDADKTGICVIELNDNADVFRSHDQTGLQDITSATVAINAMRTVDFNDSASFTSPSSTVMNIEQGMDMFCWANVWTARQTITATQRLTAYGSIKIGTTQQSTGRHGAYTRGEQTTQDCFGGSFHPSGIYAVSTNDDIIVEMDPLSGTEGGGNDRTQVNTVGFLAINLDTLASTDPEFSQLKFRIRKDDGSESGASWYAAENVDWTPEMDTNFRVRFALEETNGYTASAIAFKLQYSYNDGAWTDVTTTSSYVKIVDSTNLTDGADCTQQITTGNFITNNNSVCDADGTTGTMDFTANYKSEAEFSLQLIGNDLSCPYTVELRMVESDGTTLSLYPQIPLFGGNYVDIPTPFDLITDATLYRADKGTVSRATKIQGNIRITQDARSCDTDTTTGDNGVEYNFNTTPSAVDMTNEIFIYSVAFNAPNRLQCESKANHGMVFWLHTGASNYKYWLMGGNDTDMTRHPGHRLWVVDPDSTTDMTEVGTFNKASVLYWGRSIRKKNLGTSTMTHLSFMGRAVRIDTVKTGTNIPKFYGPCARLKDLYSAVVGDDYSNVNHNYVKKIGNNYLYCCPFVVGKSGYQTKFSDEGITVVSPPDGQEDPPTKLTNNSMRVYFDLQTGDTVALSGSYNWGTRADWDMNTSETITLSGASFMGMDEITMGSGVTGDAVFNDVGKIILNASADLDGSTFKNPYGSYLLEIG